MQNTRINPRQWGIIDLTICLLFVLIPLLTHLPYRVNIFLSWDGAYRLYLGQVPFRDFGLPMGFGYWIVPALFFKIFGPTFTSLVASQCLLNSIGFLSLRGILKNLGLRPMIITLALIVFCLTYIIYNFWPWYNNSVVIFELVSIWSLTQYVFREPTKFHVRYLVFSAVMAFLSFFTKQDVGILCFLICVSILSFRAFSRPRNFAPLIIFCFSFFVVAAVIIVPFLPFDFTYWFNLGQAPHNSRLGIARLLEASLLNSLMEKLYLGFFALFLIFASREAVKNLFASGRQSVLIFLCVALIGQAIITRVSSPLPTDHMTYFHVFGFILIATVWERYYPLEHLRTFIPAAMIILILYSSGYWNYAGRFLHLPQPSGSDTLRHHSKWITSDLPGFDKVRMPEETVSGIQKLIDQGPYPKGMKVLNMSELTPLAVTLKFEPLTHQPLWYHLNIGIFKREVDTLCLRVKRREYDLVLFEDIPDLTHFYPYQVRDSLRKYYHHDFDFLAPRKFENSTIEVYSKKELN